MVLDESHYIKNGTVSKPNTWCQHCTAAALLLCLLPLQAAHILLGIGVHCTARS